jgi:hypothetical protein
MLCFLNQLTEFTYQHEPWTGVIAADSLTWLDTIRGVSRNEYGIAYEDISSEGLPLETLSPEWDIVTNIYGKQYCSDGYEVMRGVITILLTFADNIGYIQHSYIYVSCKCIVMIQGRITN